MKQNVCCILQVGEGGKRGGGGGGYLLQYRINFQL